MDGELSSEAGRFLARRMGSDESLGGTWQRYHLIRDCLRRPGESFSLTRLSIDLDQVDAMDNAPDGRMRGALPGWLKPVAGGAIAASVAAAVVMVTLNLGAPTADDPAEPFASPNSAGLSPVSQPASLRAGTADSQRSLNRYILRHNQAAGAVGQQGFVSFGPIASSATPVQIIEQGDTGDDEEPGDTDVER